MVVHTCDPSTWETEARGSFQGHPQLHREFKVSLGCIRPYSTSLQKQFLKTYVEVQTVICGATMHLQTNCECSELLGLRIRSSQFTHSLAPLLLLFFLLLPVLLLPVPAASTPTVMTAKLAFQSVSAAKEMEGRLWIQMLPQKKG